MAANANIYFQHQAPDILGNVVKGLGARADMDQNNRLKEQSDRAKRVDEAYKVATITNPDGTTTLDQNKVLTGLAQVGGKEYMDAKSQFEADALAKQKTQYEQLTRKNGFISSAANTALKTPALYPQIRNDLISSGMVTAQDMPEQYDENFVRSAIARGQSLQQQLDNDYRNAELSSRAEDRKAAREERRMLHGLNLQDRQDARADKADAAAAAKLEAQKKITNEVEDRRRNIHDSIDLLDQMIAEKGTYEMFGSHNQDMDRLVDQIATDMSKLQDPSSVARPSEVEAVKKNLIQSGIFQNKNSTAREILKNFKQEVERRANTAYQVRGVPLPGQVQQQQSKTPAVTNQDLNDAFNWAKQNPNDPRAKQIMSRIGGD